MSFIQMLDQLFNDHIIGKNAVYRPAGLGDGYIIRVMTKSPDAISSFGEARIHSSTMILEARTNEVLEPAIGDTFTIGDRTYLLQSEAFSDRDRLVWALDVRPL